ncbi:helix-turn-helix domain-containing protein [Sinorhizobium sp. 7-81]|nr:helix-turn-helix domain-containing protein [Sinorhizobium sp. 8-89]MDK1491212.1 helix-turn-helix domain-containing protein [Sinorhizobium sp. 8-89]
MENRRRVIDLPMTRLDVADFLGMTIETVSRTITKRTGSGVIATLGRHAIALLRMDALLALANGEGDDGALRRARNAGA